MVQPKSIRHTFRRQPLLDVRSIFMFIITMNFGSGYIVWDKSATIDFLKPAKGTILGIFEISKDRLEQIRAEVDDLGKNTYHFEADLVDGAGQAVARVRKEVYVRSKAVDGHFTP